MRRSRNIPGLYVLGTRGPSTYTPTKKGEAIKQFDEPIVKIGMSIHVYQRWADLQRQIKQESEKPLMKVKSQRIHPDCLYSAERMLIEEMNKRFERAHGEEWFYAPFKETANLMRQVRERI